jgi:hypothetical protein
MRNFAIAGILGVAVTLLLFAVAFVAGSAGHTELARALFWQNELLQALIPRHNIGTPEHPIYEGTPLHLIGFIASIPIGFVIYGVLAYIALRLLRRNT